MICKPCREPHEPADCIDAVAVPPREGMTRWCYCQHAPRQDVALGGVGLVTTPEVARQPGHP